MPDLPIFISCEHASNHVPEKLKKILGIPLSLLKTHRGYDIGALPAAESFKNTFKAPFVFGRASRLVVDLNRRENNKSCFSVYSRSLPPAERVRLLRDWHAPHRQAVFNKVQQSIKQNGRVIHFAVHSFAPSLRGKRRQTDIGLLYDPARSWEKKLGDSFQAALRKDFPSLTVHKNRPYKGISDGLPTFLRTVFPNSRYAGFEIEINQRLLENPMTASKLGRGISSSLRSLLLQILYK